MPRGREAASFFELAAVFGPEMDEYALDMLAGADQVGFVIWTGAGILQLVQ